MFPGKTTTHQMVDHAGCAWAIVVLCALSLIKSQSIKSALSVMLGILSLAFMMMCSVYCFVSVGWKQRSTSCEWRHKQ